MSATNRSSVKLRNVTGIICFSFLIIQCVTESKMDYRTKMELAREHYQRVAPQIICGEPRPKIFRVGTTSMQLVPSATVVHRCGDHSGCCTNAMHRCMAKTKENVKLYFLVNPLSRLPSRRKRKNKIRKFVFTNHTECHCVDMSYKPR